MPDSSISKFFEKSRKERLDIIAKFANLTDDELEILQGTDGGVSFDKADKMVENAIGTFALPLGIATNFKINGKDFQFAGFEWDYSGYTNDWQAGRISKSLAVFLEPTNPEAVYPDLLGDDLFSSNHPKAKAAQLKVRSMIIRFD